MVTRAMARRGTIFRTGCYNKVADADGRDTATPAKILTEGESLFRLHRGDVEPEVPDKSQQCIAQVRDLQVKHIDLIALSKIDQQSPLLPDDHSSLRTPRQLEEGRNNVTQTHSNPPKG
jgi:hypothetical protein